MSLRRILFLCLLPGLFQLSAFAWWDNGHMAVAYVAYQHLTPAARDRANALLKLNPYYQQWLAKIPAGTPPSDQALMLFMIAATWPDQIKQKGSGYANDPGTSDGNLPGADLTLAGQNIGYSDMLYHKYWHFVDEPFSDDGASLPKIPLPDAQTQIDLFREALASQESDGIKSYDLVWLLHLVGDVHQPLHCVTRVSRADPDGDQGGNKVTICVDGNCKNELHAFWDGLPGGDGDVKTAMQYGKALPAPHPDLAADLKTADWISESFEAAKKSVYAGPIKAGDGPFTITPDYQKAAYSIARERVALGGTRLANLLNQALAVH